MGPIAGTAPYPWPYDGGCPGERLALVAAGWDRGWRARVPGPEADAADRAVLPLAATVAGAGGAIVAVACSGGVPLDPPGGRVSVQAAAGVDGFWGSGLDAALRALGATHLLVCGHGLEGPVHSTLRSANDRGYECLLIADASSPLRPDLVGPSRSMVEMSGGIFGAVGAAADVLAALDPSALTLPRRTA